MKSIERKMIFRYIMIPVLVLTGCSFSNPFLSQFSDKGTLESVSGHEDTCMSSFFALTNLRENKAVKIKIDLV